MAKNETTAAKTEKKPKQKGKVAKFFKEVFGEIKKVTWPTPKELISYTATVIVFIAIFAVIIGLLDLAFSGGLGLLTAL